MNITATLITLIIFIAIIGRIIWLQICLSKKESKWLGLILPILSFCFSLIITLSIYAYQFNTVTSARIYNERGELVSESISDESQSQTENISSSIIGSVYAFFIYNLPTVVLLVIYFFHKEKKNRQLALEKMSVQDLE